MDSVLTITSNMPTWTIYVSIALGLVGCFLGYKLLKIWMALVGFAIGMTLGCYFSYQHVANVAIAVLIGFLLGVLLGFIVYRIYLVGVFVIALVTTLGFVGQLLAHYDEPGWLWLIITLVLAIVVAILATRFVKPIIIISSSLNGAVMVMMGTFKVFQTDASNIMLLAALLLAILGIMVQFFTNKNTNHEK